MQPYLHSEMTDCSDWFRSSAAGPVASPRRCYAAVIFNSPSFIVLLLRGPIYVATPSDKRLPGIDSEKLCLIKSLLAPGGARPPLPGAAFEARVPKFSIQRKSKRACELPHRRWSSPPMDTRNPRGVTNEWVVSVEYGRSAAAARAPGGPPADKPRVCPPTTDLSPTSRYPRN
ncbi:hypothetical protein EVAR_71184_1 [Eumeta japonica]|uniref:Uncharacterized protein n=1 Tax=Eumeta variegata TaxID=151549 RepID=A0A4C2ABP5_EUMVA|nr:hypothetical protein EVAR_71184_1 [Eumeta japonica]